LNFIFKGIKTVVMRSCLIVLVSCLAGLAHSQSVSINNDGTVAHASAMLQVKSTTKGVLIPSMTTTQRNAILNAAEGLLVYDLTAAHLYVYQNASWRFFIDNSYWAQSSTRNWVYNGTDSIGIGTAAPSERLHVNGSIRATADLKVLGNAGIGISTPEQPLHIRTIASGEGIIVEAENPIIQLRQSNTPNPGYINTGFVQLSAENIRIGTNSGNANGKFIIRNNGGDRVFVDASGNMGLGVSDPSTKLDVAGNINLTGKLTSEATGTARLTPVCYGKVDNNGNILSGTGNFTVSRAQAGLFNISSSAITANSIIIAMAHPSNINASGAINGAGSGTIYLYNLSTNSLHDTFFQFVIYTP
jgi:hypothetical protein